MLRKPAELGQCPGGGCLLIRCLKNLFPVIFPEIFTLFHAALICPHNGLPHGIHLRIQQDCIVCGTIETDGKHPVQVNAVLPEFLQRAAHGGIPIFRILLRPAGMGVFCGIFFGGFPGKMTADINRGHFTAAGSEVDPEQKILHYLIPA